AEQRVDQRRHVVVVHPSTEERDLVLGRDVAAREVAQVRVHLLFRLARRQVDRPVQPHVLRDVGEQLVDRAGADGLEHRLPVGVGGGGVATQLRLPSYASRSSSSSTSDGSVSRTFTSQPSPYGSSLIFSGSSPKASLTSTISPDSGATTSDTAFTDSISAYGWSLLTVLPTSGGSTNTTSPSWSCAYQVIPNVATSPSMRAQSCSGWYLRSSG